MPDLPRLPTELHECIVDAIYEDRASYPAFSASCSALRSCSLVCRTWRPRSQRWLFHAVELSDAKALYRFVTLLETAPSLAGYVRILHLIGRHHDPRSVVALFPALLRSRLPNLCTLSIIHVAEGLDGAPEPEHRRHCEDRAAQGGSNRKTLPCLPLHPRFPTLLAPFATIRKLYLNGVKFPSFGDLARTLCAFRELRDLRCSQVQWAVLGSVPQCLLQAHATESSGILPHLSTLKVRTQPGMSVQLC